MNVMPSRDHPRKKRLVEIAETTLDAIDRGSYMVEGVGEIYLSEAVARCVENTRLYAPDSVLHSWSSPPSTSSTSSLSRAQVRCFFSIFFTVLLICRRLSFQLLPLQLLMAETARSSSFRRRLSRAPDFWRRPRPVQALAL